MWNPTKSNQHPGYDPAVPDQKSGAEASTSGEAGAPAAMTTSMRLLHDYATDNIIRGAAKRAEPPLYTIPDTQSQPFFLDTLTPVGEEYWRAELRSPFARHIIIPEDYDKHFDTTERKLYGHFVGKINQRIPIADLMNVIGWSFQATQAKINRLNQKLQDAKTSKILVIPKNSQAETLYLLEPSQPQVVIASQHFELREKTFCSWAHNGQPHEIPIRHEEFLVLRTIIEGESQGTSKAAIEQVLYPPGENQNYDGGYLAQMIYRLNQRLKQSTISIANLNSHGRTGLYVLKVTPAKTGAVSSLPA